jgi:hypothetical protein
VLRLHLFGFDGFGVASNATSSHQAGRGCPSTARATVASCAGPPHPQCPLRRRPRCSDATRGSYKTSYAMEVVATCLDGLVVTPIGGRGRGPPRHGAHAEVVATTGEPLVQRLSPPLASRSELASNATLLVQSSPYL